MSDPAASGKAFLTVSCKLNYMEIDAIITVNNIIGVIIGGLSLLTSLWGIPKIWKKWRDFNDQEFVKKVKSVIQGDIDEIKGLIKKVHEDSDYIKKETQRQSAVDHDIQLKLDRLEKHNLMLNDLSDLPTFLCDTTGSNFYVNPAYCKMLQTSKEQLLNFGWRSYIDPENSQEYDKVWQDALKNGRAIYNLMVFLRKENGNVFSATLNCYPIANGKPHEFIGRIVPLKNQESY